MKKFTRHMRQVGFTLVELMVSMVIGLLIVLALVTLLINVNRNNSEMVKTNRIIENGRFALQLLGADISHVGYWGGFIPAFDDMSTVGVPIDVPTAVPDPCVAMPWSAQVKTNLIGIAVQSYEIPAVVPSPTLSVCASKVTNPKASTDVLFVRHTETCVPGLGTCAVLAPGELYFQVARCGDVVPSPAYALNPYVPADIATDFPLKNKFTVVQANCTNASSSELRKFVSNLYYIRNYAVTSGDGIPTLMRSQFGVSGGFLEHQSADALIEGIEGFRVEFGIDNMSDSGDAVNFGNEISWANASNLKDPTNRGDGIPDGNYIRCTTVAPCSAAQLMNAVAVKLYVLVRSEKSTPGYIDTKTYQMGSTSLGPFDDGFKRHLFTQTVRLTNVSSRRETP